jgi:hypothetical protein
VEKLSRETVDAQLRSQLDIMAERLKESETGRQSDDRRSQNGLADLRARLEASEKLASDIEGRAEELDGELRRHKTDSEAQSATILELQQVG